jgi:ADP-heptose:LPS heptosyltransferase
MSSIGMLPVDPDLRAWQDASNILIVRLDNLGDVLMSTPAISAVRQRCAGKLTLLTSRVGAAAAAHVPALDDVIVYDAPWVKVGAGSAPSADRRMIARLARRRFDAAIVFTVCTQSALPAAMMCRLAGIGLRLAHSRENPYGLLSHWVPDTEVCADGMRHEVMRQLDLVRAVGFEAADDALVFRCVEKDIAVARRKLFEAGADPQRPHVVVHTGSSAASRRYPAERFGRAAAGIAKSSDAQIVFVGGRDEVEQACQAQVAMGAPSISLAGMLTLGELAALIADASLVVCNNSGPAHLAAAGGTPVVVLYALTNPQHTPWKVPCRILNELVPCRNCLKSVCPQGHHRCLLGVEPDRVADAALELLREVSLPARDRLRAVA